MSSWTVELRNSGSTVIEHREGVALLQNPIAFADKRGRSDNVVRVVAKGVVRYVGRDRLSDGLAGYGFAHRYSPHTDGMEAAPPTSPISNGG